MKSTNVKGTSVYKLSGVDIEAADNAKEHIKLLARKTFRPEVLTDIGLFGSLFQIKGNKNTVLVSSTDGVGTKLKIASLMGRYNTVGHDIVNHCVNDILCCGAEPLFFLDYIAMGKLEPDRVAEIVSGLAQACARTGCSLIGGETAEMPGVYQENDFDLVGFIVGSVQKKDIINVRNITPDDTVIGLPSSGLHTNGYSLVRKIFNIDKQPKVLNKKFPGIKHALGEELLIPHQCYYPALKPYLKKIKGMAHITGGGFKGNIPRILPEGMAVTIDTGAWKVPPIFKLIQRTGRVSEEEMYRVFNMGIGMVIICSAPTAKKMRQDLPQSIVLGKVTKSDKEKVIFK